ncbi:MAG: CDP-glycerol glycerophosphotransferase family protein [Thermoflavifilum sp.]|nr:CDP-glycerol glycerophosphotransferase family protein [Thermoflavifilum sp.]MCL6514308.1 CDP-glycerol glycerophosphotransferase family protein [Alicyclobacillus sp.]
MRTPSPKGNLAAVVGALERAGWHGERVFLFHRYSKTVIGQCSTAWYFLRAGYHLARSRYFVIDDYFFPAYVIQPRAGTDIVQLWHAAGAFKKFGYSAIGTEFGPSQRYLQEVPVHANYSWVFVSAREVVPFYAEAFNMPEERVLPLGVPRTDVFFDDHARQAARQHLIRSHPELAHRKIVLYAPTYRGRSYTPDEFVLPLQARQMAERLGDAYALVVHLHPYVRRWRWPEGEEAPRFAYVVDDMSMEELMFVADVLVTDYSSVIFDFSLLDRPMAFLAPDLEDYLRERNFYYNYMDLVPGPIFRDTASLSEWIQRREFDMAQIKRFRDRFFDHQDGHSSDRIVRYLLERA